MTERKANARGCLSDYIPNIGELRISAIPHTLVSTPVCDQLQVSNLRTHLFSTFFLPLSFLFLMRSVRFESAPSAHCHFPSTQTITVNCEKLVVALSRHAAPCNSSSVVSSSNYSSVTCSPSGTMQKVVRRQNHSREQVPLCHIHRMPLMRMLLSLFTMLCVTLFKPL